MQYPYAVHIRNYWYDHLRYRPQEVQYISIHKHMDMYSTNARTHTVTTFTHSHTHTPHHTTPHHTTPHTSSDREENINFFVSGLVQGCMWTHKRGTTLTRNSVVSNPEPCPPILYIHNCATVEKVVLRTWTDPIFRLCVMCCTIATANRVWLCETIEKEDKG